MKNRRGHTSQNHGKEGSGEACCAFPVWDFWRAVAALRLYVRLWGFSYELKELIFKFIMSCVY